MIISPGHSISIDLGSATWNNSFEFYWNNKNPEIDKLEYTYMKYVNKIVNSDLIQLDILMKNKPKNYHIGLFSIEVELPNSFNNYSKYDIENIDILKDVCITIRFYYSKAPVLPVFENDYSEEYQEFEIIFINGKVESVNKVEPVYENGLFMFPKQRFNKKNGIDEPLFSDYSGLY